MHTRNTALAIILALSAGCSEILADFTFYTPDAGGQEDGGPPTDAGCESTCGGSCVVLQTDPLHCGSCATSCSAPENGEATCTDGTCGFTCDPGYYAVVGTCEPLVAPRPIAPLSTATATSRRPTFRWELAPRNDGARVEICADRGCTTVVQTIDASGTSGRPPADLPTGIVFWRLYGRDGADVGATPSPTWQLYVGARSAEVDTSWGTTLDVNGDGFADVLVGAPHAALSAGHVYLYLGAASGLTSPPRVLDNGPDGGEFGSAVTSAGDVDGDGYADVMIGAPSADSSTGRAYLYRGGPGGLSSSPAVVDNAGGGRFGSAVASAGDVDGDGYADVLVGARSAAAGAGRAYLYRGGPDGLSSSPVILDNGVDGGYFGVSVASAGDVDGDGYADVIIGAPGAASDTGRAYLYRGGTEDLSSSPIVLDNGADGGQFGSAVASAGDVDGDGYADVIVGAYNASGAGRAYIYRGGPSSLLPSPVVLDNGAEGGYFGGTVASAGDVDGDGYVDVLIGAPSADATAGRVYLYRGGADGLSSSPVAIDNGADGGQFGASLASAGDVDADGYADAIVGASYADAQDGRVYLYGGGRSGLSSSPVVLDNGAEGGYFGASVASAVEIYGKGLADFTLAWVLLTRDRRISAEG